jgi:broad specificity phosphatase PhoE
MQGRRINPSLAPSGVEQAKLVGRALAHRPLKAVYSSPLLRAAETAAAVAAPHGLGVVTIEGLTEVEIGEWEDRSWPDIEATDPVRYSAFREDPERQGYPGGENLADVARRMLEAMGQIARDHQGEEIAVVAHSVVNRVYLGELLHVPLALRRKIPQDNCGISLVECRPGKQRVRTLNGVVHLEC